MPESSEEKTVVTPGKQKGDSPLRLLALFVESLADKGQWLLRFIRRKERLPLTAKVHNALALPHGVKLQGRVLAAKELPRPRAEAGAWENLGRMLHLWMTDEEPHTTVTASCEEQTVSSKTDEEGYFTIDFEGLRPTSESKIHLTLPEAENPHDSTSAILRPGKDHSCVIISDIDDTVIRTNAASTFRMIKTTLFGNMLTRQVFPGTGPLYRALKRGRKEGADENNPVFYVTSSPWNLRGFLQSVFEYRGLPRGGYFMTDWGLDKEKWFSKSHDEHKIESIEQVIRWFPDKPIIMFGDSGQRDPEIYSEILKRNPDRIAAIFIRDVTGWFKKERSSEVEQMAVEARNQGKLFSLIKDSAEAAELLAGDNWLNGHQLEVIEVATRESAAAELAAGAID